MVLEEEEYKFIIITEPIRGKYLQMAEALHYTVMPDTERTQGGTYLDVRVFDERGEEWRRWLDLEKKIVFMPTEENRIVFKNIQRLIAEEKILALQITEEIGRLRGPILPENVDKYFTHETPEEMRQVEGE
jgi:hypothetical protein